MTASDSGTRPRGILPPGAIRQLDRLKLAGRRELIGQGIGQRASLRRKPAPDFVEHRAYVPGDDVRYVDWRASARSEHVYVRQGVLPQEVGVHVLLDTSASMGWGEPAKSRGQQLLAASLGYLALANSDRLFVLPYGDDAPQPLGPLSGKSQITTLIQYLGRLRYAGDSDLLPASRRLARRFSRGGLLYILSDLLSEDDLTPVLDLFPPPQWNVHVIQPLHPAELDPTVSGLLQLVDSESGAERNVEIDADALASYQQRFAAWWKRIELTCIENYATHTILPTDATANETYARLRAAHIVETQ